MTFAWPHLLWLLFVPAAGLAWDLSRRRAGGAAVHPRIPRAEAGSRALTLTEETAEGAGAAKPVRLGAKPRWWLAAGLALGLIALARPQWGRIDEPVFEQAREILLAVDLSRSMLSTDVKPSRLERAKLLIESLLDHLAGERVGLVSFAGTAFLQAPLSADYEILREFLPSLGPGFMPVGGTDYGALIEASAGAFGPGRDADRFLVILSDGGANDEGWEKAVAKLKEKGVHVIGLGIGTAAGALVPDGAGGFVKDERGAVVMAKLESDTLKKLAEMTGGAYRDASDWIDLAALLKSTVEAAHKGRFLEKNTVRYAERYQWALGAALLCLLISFYREFPVRPKPREIRIGTAEGESRKAAVEPPILAMLIAMLGILAAPRGLAVATESAPPPPGAMLGRVVGRLSTQDTRSALDWLQLSRETVGWGQQLQTSGQAVPPGPVRDGLAAAEAGAALDPKAADWASLREQLRALLKQPEEQKQKKPDQQKNQDKNQSSQNQQKQSGGQDKKQDQSQSQSGSDPSDPSKSDQAQNQPDQKDGSQKPTQGQSPAPSAFGDMKPSAKPPPSGSPSSDQTQRVGGKPERTGQEASKADPATAPLWQKLEAIRDKDSPAALYQMFEKNEPHPADKKGKDW